MWKQCPFQYESQGIKSKSHILSVNEKIYISETLLQTAALIQTSVHPPPPHFLCKLKGPAVSNVYTRKNNIAKTMH